MDTIKISQDLMPGHTVITSLGLSMKINLMINSLRSKSLEMSYGRILSTELWQLDSLRLVHGILSDTLKCQKQK